jgi:peptidoglycan/xylan/chitin deacetylase (PgdA/CDA1 family)/ketosteroid isomerase-like protein
MGCSLKQGLWGICVFVAVAFAADPADAQQSPTWTVAITIDDVPMTGGAGCRREDIVPVNDAILGALAAHGVRAVGFFVPGAACQGEGEASPLALARRWRAAGHEVGNHSYLHRDYNNLTAREYLDDAARAHETLEPVLVETGQANRWFRPPLLHAGADRSKRRQLDDWLARNRYAMGVVTIDNQEWVYAAAYDRARARGDASLAAAVAAAYVEHIEESVDYYRSLSRTVFGRDVAQVLLLHANRLNADHLDALLLALERGGARFVPMSEAVRDPAYASRDSYVGRRGLSWLQRWALTREITPPPEPRESAWVSFAATEEVQVDARIEAALSAANNEFSRAWVAGEGAALAGMYTRYAVLHPSAGGVIASAEAVAAFWGTLDQISGRVGHRLEPTLRRALGDGAIIEMGRWHTERQIEGAVQRQSGCYTLVWRQDEDGRWRMAYDGWTAANDASWACRPR